MTLHPSERPDSREAPDWLGAGVAAGLATLGIALAVIGERTGRPLWQNRIGPTLTLVGAAVWVWRRGRRRRPR